MYIHKYVYVKENTVKGHECHNASQGKMEQHYESEAIKHKMAIVLYKTKVGMFLETHMYIHK